MISASPAGDKRRPMGVMVKICGISSPDAGDAALRAGADFLGFVFFPRSPRRVTPDAARALRVRLGEGMRAVAVFADADDADIDAAMSALRPAALQLHGRETPSRVADLRSRCGVPVIRGLPVAEAADLAAAAAFAGVADYFLFDAKPASDAPRPGGHGAAFDWRILKDRDIGRPYFLAGGLTPENVGRAIAISGAPGVDVSSGVEDSPGIKNPERVTAFVRAVRAAGFSEAAT